MAVAAAVAEMMKENRHKKKILPWIFFIHVHLLVQNKTVSNKDKGLATWSSHLKSH